MPSTPVAVVTGGGRGIGRGIVGELAAIGMTVVINYRSDAAAADESRAEALGRGSPRVLTIAADVSDPVEGRRLLGSVLDAFGRVDLWVNNAGVAPESRLDLLDASPESWDRVLGTNLRGPFFLSQAVARAMIDLRAAGVVDDPQIHFITSVSAELASVQRGDYCVSKAGLSMAAKLFAARLADEGVRVFEIRPGIIATDMTGPVREHYDRRIAEGLVPIRRWGTPADVGKIVAALASGAFPFATGAVLNVDGGLHLPRL